MKYAIKNLWEAAKTSLLTLDWPTFGERTIQAEIRDQLPALRTRANEQVQNNVWARAFLRDLANNVVGPRGPTLILKHVNSRGTRSAGIETAIQSEWKAWQSWVVPTTNKRLDFVALLRGIMNSQPRDGEILLRKHWGGEYSGNRFGFALEPIPSSWLPVGLNIDKPGHPRIIMGVEVDSYLAPVAYYISAKRTEETVRLESRDYLRIPAKDIYHVFITDWLEQTRGYPWLATGLVDAKMLYGAREAELVATRISASKMGFFYEEGGQPGYTGTGTTETGETVSKVAPGMFERLPAGTKFAPFDPQHPNGDYGAYEARILRGLSAGWGDAYHSMTGDTTDANYSTLRQVNLDMRQHWLALQEWFISSLVARIFDDWLQNGLALGTIQGANGRALAPSVYRGITATFRGPRWQGVDPLKEAKADDTQIKNGTKSRAEVIRDRGLEPEDVFAEIESEVSNSE
jgi:lambda family phage portal protein